MAHDGKSNNESKTKPNFDVRAISDPKEATSFHYGEKGHWRRSYPKYLQDLKNGKIKVSSLGIYTSVNNTTFSIMGS